MAVATVAVIDGQGGGVGKALIERLRQAFDGELTIIALGTNSLATSQMLKAGADEGATGENAIVVNAGRMDALLGAVGILSANAMLGEVTPAMALAIASSPAPKVLVPLNRCNLRVVGLKEMPFSSYIDEAVAELRTLMKGR